MEAKRGGCCKFQGMRAAERCSCCLWYAASVSAAASRLLCYLVHGVWSRFCLMLVSPDTSFCQSQPGQMPVHCEHTDTYLHRRAGWLQQQGFIGCARRWLTERRLRVLDGKNWLSANTRLSKVLECITVWLWVFIISVNLTCGAQSIYVA